MCWTIRDKAGYDGKRGEEAQILDDFDPKLIQFVWIVNVKSDVRVISRMI